MSIKQPPEWVLKRSAGPGRPTRATPNNRYPWDTTPVGETFDIPAGPNQPKRASVATYCKWRRRKGQGDFICHQYPDGLIQVYRRG